jgi:PAS domain S-box-containing protein
MTEFARSLLANGALLMAISGLYDILSGRIKGRSPAYQAVLTGLMFGGGAVLVMLFPIRYNSGVIFDARGVILALAPLYVSPGGAALAGVIAVMARILIGGVGAPMGVLAVAIAVGGGFVYRWRFGGHTSNVPNWHFLGLGLAVHVLTAIGFIIVLPPDIGLKSAQSVGPMMLLINTPMTWLVGYTLKNSTRRKETEEHLHKNHRREQVMSRIHSQILGLRNSTEIPRHLQNEWVEELRSLGLPANRISLQQPSTREGHHTAFRSLFDPSTETAWKELPLAQYPWVREAWESGQPVVVDHQRLAAVDFWEEDIRTIVEIPLPGGGRSLGVNSKVECAFDEEAVHTLKEFAGLLATALQRLHDFEAQQMAMERSETILHSMPGGMLIIEAETHEIIDANAIALAMVGIEKEEMIGRTCHRFICPQEEGACPVTDESKRIDTRETVLLTKDGGQTEILKTVVPITLEKRECLLETFVDITPRKQAEQALLKAHQWTEAESAVRLQIALMEEPTDLDKVVAETERKLQKLGVFCDDLTLQVANADGTDFVSIGADHDAVILHHPVWREGISWSSISSNVQDYPWVIQVWQTKTPHYDPCVSEGSRMPTGLSLLDVPFSQGTLAINHPQSHAFTEEDIAVLQRLADVISDGFQRFLDIIQRKKAEDKLRKSEEQYRELFNRMSSGVAVYEAIEGGKDFVFVDLNETGEKITHATRESVIGRRVTEVFPGVREIGLVDILQTVWETGQAQRHPASLYKDGRVSQWVENEVYRLPDGKVVALYDDATEKKQMEEELIRTQRLRAVGELSAGVSHNLNNILSGVLAPAQLLERMTDDPDILLEVEEIISAGRRARDLVHKLHLSVRGIEEDTLQPVLVANVVRETIQTTRPRWKDEPESRGIGIEIATQLAETPPVEGNESGLHEILTNLIFNAVDAMPDGGTITIETQQVANQVQLTVCDTGIGMDEETRRRVFEPFFTTKMDIGTGLGLSTAHNAVMQWGGTMDVDSIPGEGTTFILRLPIWKEEAIEKSETTEERKVRPGRVLIIDDDAGICSLLSRLLGRTHEVETSLDGRKALEQFVVGRYDVVLIDLGMVGMSGDRVATELRQRDILVSTVLITGWELDDDDPRKAPFDLQLAKPFDDLDVIEAVVAQAMELHDERANKEG